MKNPIIITHAKGAPGLRIFGIGAYLKPSEGVQQLLKLLNDNSSWATNRSQKDVKSMLEKSSIVVSAWNHNQMIGFGRATTDEIFRAVLWDVVVDKQYQKKGIGKRIVQTILDNPKVSRVEKIYIMTTNCRTFYSNIGFKLVKDQILMTLKNNY